MIIFSGNGSRSDHLFLVGINLKLQNAWGQTVNIKLNAFYSTFTDIFLIFVTFLRLLF